MIFFDYLTFNPWDELQSAWQRTPSAEFSRGDSLKGRTVCVWKTCYHTAGLFLKPLVYIALGVLLSSATMMWKSLVGDKAKFSAHQLGKDLILTGLVAPLGQIAQIFKAAMGILYPGFYFKEDEIDSYFKELASIAVKVNCEQELVNLFNKGSSIIALAQQTGGSRLHYEALIKRDLALICGKLKGSDLSLDEKFAILQMFAPMSSDPRESGLQACTPGVARMLEQICACLDVPEEPERVIPWLVIQFKEEILHQMTMQLEATGKYMRMIEDPSQSEITMDPSHFGNILIANIGEQIALPQEMIDKASEDVVFKVICLSEDDKQELVDLFKQLYTEEALEKYLMTRINSQPDGGPGLKDFRNYIIKKLSENISDEEIESSLEDVQDQFNVGEDLADDPVFYVKLHYFLYPNADPSDENSSDLNEKGIRFFASTLESDPFDFFVDELVEVG